MATELTPQLRSRIENTIRFLAVDAVEKANSGHPGAPMALAAPIFELFDSQLRFDPADPDWPMRDRFVLSNGHASMLLYALLHLYGYDLSLDDIKDFRQLGANTPGHPEYGDTPGVEVTTGPLGQGISNAVGMALAGRMTRSQFGQRDGDPAGTPGGHFVYGVCGDGDLMEGVSSEASSLAGHLGLGNLIFLYDDNRITIDGETDISFTENTRMRYEAYGWHVIDGIDGTDPAGLRVAIERAKSEGNRPSLLMVRTLIGLGSRAIEGTPKAHGNPLGQDEVGFSKDNMGWPREPTFFVPDDVRAYFEARCAKKRAERVALDARTDAWRSAESERAAAWEQARTRALPSDLGSQLASGMAGVESATRKHAARVLQKLSTLVPYLAGGSADLAGSAAPPIVDGVGIVGKGKDPFAGRNIHFGVREHAMGSIANGIALDKTFIAYCGTFLIFSDYMRPAIRLAALMKLPVIYIFTHDSIFVGEDGPTHQPVEQLDSLRAIPGLTVFRPADGIETAMAYAWALERAEGPTLLSLTRQSLPAIDRGEDFALEDVWNGAYAVVESHDPDAVVIATGSEVSLSVEAARLLADAGVCTRVVSMPSVERFLDQPDEVRDALIPPGVPTVAVEAGRAGSFHQFVGRQGLIYGIESFGRSGPLEDLGKHFGFVPEALSTRILEYLGK